MRLSSSLSGKFDGESIMVGWGRECFEFNNPELVACGTSLLGGVGVCIGLVVGRMVDLVDFGVGMSMMLSKVNWLDCGLGLGFNSEFGLVGVNWKVFVAWFSGKSVGGNRRSNQFHHHGNTPDRMLGTPV